MLDALHPLAARVPQANVVAHAIGEGRLPVGTNKSGSCKAGWTRLESSPSASWSASPKAVCVKNAVVSGSRTRRESWTSEDAERREWSGLSCFSQALVPAGCCLFLLDDAHRVWLNLTVQRQEHGRGRTGPAWAASLRRREGHGRK